MTQIADSVMLISNIRHSWSVTRKLSTKENLMRLIKISQNLRNVIVEKKTFKALCKSVIKTGLGDALVSVACSGNWVNYQTSHWNIYFLVIVKDDRARDM